MWFDSKEGDTRCGNMPGVRHWLRVGCREGLDGVLLKHLDARLASLGLRAFRAKWVRNTMFGGKDTEEKSGE